MLLHDFSELSGICYQCCRPVAGAPIECAGVYDAAEPDNADDEECAS